MSFVLEGLPRWRWTTDLRTKDQERRTKDDQLSPPRALLHHPHVPVHDELLRQRVKEVRQHAADHQESPGRRESHHFHTILNALIRVRKRGDNWQRRHQQQGWIEASVDAVIGIVDERRWRRPVRHQLGDVDVARRDAVVVDEKEMEAGDDG